MAELVHNALGGTAERPCPTRASSWFEYGHCSKDDVQMWRAAAANLYQLGVTPLLEQLERVDAVLAAEFRPRAVLYRTQYQSLPASGSLLSTARNLETVSDVVALMQAGNQLIVGMQEAVSSRNVQPVEVGLPPPPDKPVEKSPLSRYAWPTAIVGSVAVVLGLTYLATREPKGSSDAK